MIKSQAYGRTFTSGIDAKCVDGSGVTREFIPKILWTNCREIVAIVFICLVILMVGCRSLPPPVPWQENCKSWFPNASIRPPEPERSLWNREEEDLFLRRVGFSDCVLVASVRVTGTYSFFGTPRQLNLWIKPEEIIYGKDRLKKAMDQEKEFLLQLVPSSSDFSLAIHFKRQLPGQRYIVLLKREPPTSDKSSQGGIWHWALYHKDPRLLAELRAIFQLYMKHNL